MLYAFLTSMIIGGVLGSIINRLLPESKRFASPFSIIAGIILAAGGFAGFLIGLNYWGIMGAIIGIVVGLIVVAVVTAIIFIVIVLTMVFLVLKAGGKA